MNLLLPLFLIFKSIFNFSSVEAELTPFSTRFESGIITGIMTNPILSEASGMTASITNPGYYWVINDSGNPAEIFLLDSMGTRIQKYNLKDAVNIDWEDIVAVENQKNNSSQLIVADIGDNFGIRPYIQLLVMEEPTLTQSDDTTISDFQTYKYVFEDGARDAETILADPLSNELYIVSKREPQVGIYAVPDFPFQESTDTLRLISRLPFNKITAGSISPDGKEILLKNYDAIFYWSREGRQLLPTIMQTNHELIAYLVEPQGESITWNRQGNGFYTLSELSYSDNQRLYFYKKK